MATKRVDNVVDEDIVNEQEHEQAAAAPSKMLVWPLNKPIKSYGEEITAITMRRPNGHDLLIVGNPVLYYPHVDPPRVEHDFPKVVTMVARLSEPKIPTTSLAELDPLDIVGLAWAISPFFIPAR
jgi:tail assembly chaperone E/41/14-like protein